MRTIFLLLIIVFPYSSYSKGEVEQSIGSIKMLDDKSIVLVLRAESEDGIIGQSQFTYKPSDSEYQNIIEHVGGIKVGEEKLVTPWE